MVKKAKLTKMTNDWIDEKKPGRHKDVKAERRKDVKAERHKDVKDRARQTFHISKQAMSLLWHNRAETGQPMSNVVESLVIKHLGKK